jgi:hypothetical protein
MFKTKVRIFSDASPLLKSLSALAEEGAGGEVKLAIRRLVLISSRHFLQVHKIPSATADKLFLGMTGRRA